IGNFSVRSSGSKRGTGGGNVVGGQWAHRARLLPNSTGPPQDTSPNVAGAETLPGGKGTQGQEGLRPPPVSLAPRAGIPLLEVPPAPLSSSAPSPAGTGQCPGGAARRPRPLGGPDRAPGPGLAQERDSPPQTRGASSVPAARARSPAPAGPQLVLGGRAGPLPPALCPDGLPR
ncbi:hypothetical protein DBR06_SOUSAS10510025, partial [Sousa chinensis]